MTIPNHIPTEFIQRFTSAQAWEYLLVPFESRGGGVRCFGEETRDYSGVIVEIEVLHGFKVEIEVV
ncbi:MAG: type II/IV secretion system protein, partial [Alistipes sp.]|nr:type II/IV secretion system protein [Alistipes sp.]